MDTSEDPVTANDDGSFTIGAPAAASSPVITPRCGPITTPSFLQSDGVRAAGAVLATASMAASAYHGYERNGSVGWALWWGLMGSLFPVITPVIAIAQGFAKPDPEERLRRELEAGSYPIMQPPPPRPAWL